MKYSNTRVLLAILAMTATFAGMTTAQTTGGSVSGSVVDSSGLGMPAVSVTLTNEETGNHRTAFTGQDGGFLFTAALPGRYTVAVEAKGFKGLEKKNLNLTANERLAVGRLSLDVGSVSESVTVEAQGQGVSTESSERSALLTKNQMDTLMDRGRNFYLLLDSLPGAVGGSLFKEYLGSGRPPTMNGMPDYTVSTTVDGLAGHDASNPNFHAAIINMDAIAEVKVQTTNYKAEYGRNGGAVITTVTKSGTVDFHGTGYYYKRHEQFNANTWANNRNGSAKPRYRFNTFGGTIGGPVYIPGKFNRNKDKLFFFFDVETYHNKQANALVTQTQPTDLERAGNFSQSLDLGGKLIPVIDPLTNSPFPGNIIPVNRINSNGLALLKLLPAPNFFDRATSKGNYNYLFQESASMSALNPDVRVDYNATSNFRIFGRITPWHQDTDAFAQQGLPAWPAFQARFTELNPSYLLSSSYTVSPTIVIEASIGMQYRGETLAPIDQTQLARYTRAGAGITMGQLYPSANGANLIPTFSFSGGVPPNTQGFSVRGDFPDRLWQPIIPVTASVTQVLRAHTLKAGIYFENVRSYRHSGGNSTSAFNGSIDFGKNTSNPNDSGYGFSNALLGVFNSYTEVDRRPNQDLRGKTFEWFLQDTWKISRKLTVDYGARFSFATPYSQQNGLGVNFIPNLYASQQTVVMFQPVITGGGKFAKNPLTGALFPAAYVGAIVPGQGDPNNGLVSGSAAGVPSGLVNNTSLMPGPRAGFAYDVFGNGKTAIRGGFGISNLTHLGMNEAAFLSNAQNQPTIYYGNLNSLLSSSGVLFPKSIAAIDVNRKNANIYSMSLGVQQEIGFATVLDVAYVGTLGRHLNQTRPLNNVPYGSRVLAGNQDPTSPGKPLPDNFFRPFPGYNSVSYQEGAGSSNYHSLQAQATRRFARGLQFSGSWTWSKYMSYSNPPQYLNYRVWGYGRDGNDHTHLVRLTASYDLPKVGTYMWDNPMTRLVFNNWQISTWFSAESGAPSGIGYSTTDGRENLLGGDGGRVVTIANPNGDRSISQYFNTAAFAMPALLSYGNAARDAIRGPGFYNIDFSLFKYVPIKERVKIQYRCEVYNLLNNAQFNSINTTARFDAGTGAQINGGFGQLTGTRPSRVMQMSLRLLF